MVQFGRLVIVGLTFYVCSIRADQAEVKIVSSGPCSNTILSKKGVDPNIYRPKIIFDPKTIKTIPEKPTVPGCFRLVANNVTILERVGQLTGEFEMRISGDADPSKPALQCKKRQPKCGCGEKDSCMYCDFCKNFKEMVHEGKVNNKEIEIDQNSDGSCDCNIPKNKYTVDVEVCTPDEKELEENVPAEVIDAVSDSKAFSMFTTLYIYNFRYNSMSTSDLSDAAKKALNARKARAMMACYVIGTNISV